eukprot:382190_1
MASFLSLLLLLLWSQCTNCYHLVYLAGYPGNIKLIELTNLTATTPQMLNLSNAIDLTPVSLIGQCGNPDISPDGTQIIFGAITPNVDSWDIYSADLDVEKGIISNLQIIVNTSMREEDPRYSYDGNSFVYKAGGGSVYDIYIYDFKKGISNKLVECSCHNICESNCNHCELWGPSYHPCGHIISYTARICENDPNYDEIWIFNQQTNSSEQITSDSVPDMFSHWKRDGNLLYSHNDGSTDHLYLYNTNNDKSVLFVNETRSDDDPYAFKQDNNMFVFIGLPYNGTQYQLYLYRNGSVFQLSSESSMLGPVVFSLEIKVTIPTYCNDLILDAKKK